jgi:hypothetical protein
MEFSTVRHALLSTVVQNKSFLLCAQSNLCERVRTERIQPHNVIWSVSTCFAVLLRRPSRNEPSQNHYNGV